MGGSSKILLDFENNANPSATSSSIQSKLIVCKNDDPTPNPNPNSIKSQPAKPPKISSSAPKSQVLGKVKDFLGIMAESNKKLQIDAMNNPKEYDIEAITGDESECIEFDLMLGVADLNTPEAVAAAESAISSSYQPVIQLNGGSDSGSECEDDDDDDEEGGSKKSKRTKGNDDEGSLIAEVLGNCRSEKRSKIVEIS